MAGQVPLWREEEAGPSDLHPALGTLGLFPVSPRLEGMSQFRRDKAMYLFKKGKADILVATDVAARGIATFTGAANNTKK